MTEESVLIRLRGRLVPCNVLGRAPFADDNISSPDSSLDSEYSTKFKTQPAITIYIYYN